MEEERNINPLLSQFYDIICDCNGALDIDDDYPCEEIQAFIKFLIDQSDYALTNRVNTGAAAVSFKILEELCDFLSRVKEERLEEFSFELVKVVAKYAGVSDECNNMAEKIMDCFCENCNPRDLFTVLCEALDSLRIYDVPAIYIPLLTGVSQVILRIRKNHVKQIKLAIPAALSVLESVVSTCPLKSDKFLICLFESAIKIAASAKEVSGKLTEHDKQQLSSLLGIYVLQVMALVSRIDVPMTTSSVPDHVFKLSKFIPFCGFSYLGLITGYDVDARLNMFINGDTDDLMKCFSLVRVGACVAVLWGFISKMVPDEIGEDIKNVLLSLQDNKNNGYKAICLLRYLLSSPGYPPEFKGHIIDFIIRITSKSPRPVDLEVKIDPSCLTGMFAALQAIQGVMVYFPDEELRKKSFFAMKSVIADLPSSERITIMKALITNSTHPSMVALILDIARELFREAYNKLFLDNTDKVDGMKDGKKFLNESHGILDLIGIVLRPPKGGPPSMPENSDAVGSALNFYRYLLMLESKGKTNYSSILSGGQLQKVYSEWLLPLRTLVLEILAENEKDDSDYAVHVLCSLNIVQLTLYQCIELVEDLLKQQN